MPRTLATPPAGMDERPIRMIVEGMTALAPDADGHYYDDGTYAKTTTIVGVPHVFVADIDVTYLGGERTEILEWSLEEPFGETTASIRFPQIYPFNDVGEVGGDFPDIGNDRNCDILIVEEGVTPGVYDGTQHEVWNGILVSDESHINETSADTEWHAKGLLVGQASVQMNRVVDYMPSTDIGTVIPNLLNSVSSKRYEDIDTVVTGIMTLERGSEEDYILDRVQDLLAKAWTVDGQQWTIRRSGPKTYEMVLKDNTTIDYTLEAGTRGITANLSRDGSQKYSVIWGRGVGPDGYSWRGMQYPDFVADLTYDPDDLSVLDGPFRFPLIFDPKVNNGSLVPTGIPSVEYNEDVERSDVPLIWPPGVTKDQAYIEAGYQLTRDENPGSSGTITLRTDPEEGSRFLIPAGANLSYRNYRGGDFSTDFEPFLFHIAGIRVSLSNLEVELKVDSRYRDAMTLSSILARDREAAPDPGKRPGNVNRRSRQEPDVAIEFDGEAPGRIIPEHSLTGGEWFIFPRHLGQSNRIVTVDYHATVRYALAFFGAPITPAELTALVPDPLAVENPFNDESEALRAAGIIEGWGRLGDACGYSPGQESAGATFNGDLIDTNTIEYESVHGSWIWVCEWAEEDGDISGFINPATNT